MYKRVAIFILIVLICLGIKKITKNENVIAIEEGVTTEKSLANELYFKKTYEEKSIIEAQQAISSYPNLNDKPVVNIEPSPSFSEMVKGRGSNFFNTCSIFNEKKVSASNTQQLLLAKKLSKKSFESKLRLDYSMATSYFQFSLPISFYLYDQIDKKKLIKNSDYLLIAQKEKLELIQNLPQAKSIALRAYYALILGRIVFINPQLIGDPELTEMCERLKNNLDRIELNAMIYSYLQRAQVKPSEIKFSPQFEPQIKILESDEGFMYSEKTNKDIL